ncbi:putative polyamine transporter [Aspergillus sclerotioniger CBS 115572]|uniref:Putative polyamine transporter n=1 Tax=Aspergillus sclerotioniger CBS 115572 TaxID=1450535 RepID=A0A317VQB9_9EURO|nr:putative polyamine transporter [Aspergillus sclerotioniger CBS 115572]PWY76506.1 putative polyamine transporter [Aspergillus sclerotioniger CBS 115572]
MEPRDTPSPSPRLKTTGGNNPIVLIPQPSDDPKDPLNWSPAKKYGMLFLLCYVGFAALSLPSSQQLTYYVQASAYPGRSTVDLSYSVTVCVVGEVFGPLLFWPLARKIGRSSLMLWSLVVGLGCQIWAALMTGPTDYIPFMMSRLVSGLAASIPTVLGPSYAVDIFFLHQRGRVFSTFELSFLLGVNVAPTISGFIVNDASWTWAFWWTLIPCGLAILLVFFFLEETGGFSSSSGSVYPAQPSSYWANRVATFLPGHRIIPAEPWSQIARTAQKPLVILTAPITVIAGGYIFICFAFVILANVLLTMFLEAPVTQGGYGFTPMRNAFFTLDAWFAIFISQIAGWLMGDRIPLWASRRFGRGHWHPEYRLYNILLPGLLSPIGLGLFGAALQYHLHYMVIAVGFFLIVFSSMLSVPICLNYIVECYKNDATEAAIAMNVWRLSFAIATGFIFTPWMDAVGGPGWMFGMAAFFSLGALLMVGVLVWKGKLLRDMAPRLLACEGGVLVDRGSTAATGQKSSAELSDVESESARSDETITIEVLSAVKA